MKKLRQLFAMLFAVALLAACSEKEQKVELSIDFEKYTLDNGLDVILHHDDSDPIVAVSILVHVGSNREKPGRTGFAHFFEHMLFQKSENVEEGAFFKNINDLGGTFNGGTWTDGTVYYEVVPKDALERILWMEADRMGYFINAINVKDLEDEKPIVKNEKRQRVDNVAYGHTNYVTLKAMYPEGHPYNWEVIGELEDLEAATLDDVKEFYHKWYGPNNSTLVVTGDFDREEVKAWIEKYFGEIESAEKVEPLKPMPAVVEENIMLYHEDDYAKVPELRINWPTVEQYHDDYWALNALGTILRDGKRAHLYKVIVEDKELAPRAFSFNNSSEIAGRFVVSVRANDGVDLDEVKEAVFEAFANFEAEGFSEKDLQRIKANQETAFYNGLSSVLSKAFQLSNYNVFAGDPSYVTTDAERILGVTKEDIMRVYNQYIKDKPYVMTSFVPLGQTKLAVDGSEKAVVKIEEVTAFVPKEIEEEEFEIQKTTSKIDRSVVPELGETPLVKAPDIWESTLSNGMKVLGIQSEELPLVQFSIRIKGGGQLESKDKLGVASLLSDLMMEGTANKTPEELQDAIGQYGAFINMYSGSEDFIISGNCLSRYFDEVMGIVEEILLEPRWDEKEFDRIRKGKINDLKQRDANPNAIAGMVMSKVMYGEDNIKAYPSSGMVNTVENITLDDLKTYYSNYFAPGISSFQVAGNVSESQVNNVLKSISARWEAKEVEIPVYETKKQENTPTIYFANYSDAKQSIVNLAKLTVDADHEDYYPLTVVNYNLGGNSGAKLFQVLREEKGYTYGAYSGLSRDSYAPSSFRASSSVRSNVTSESVALFKEIIDEYKESYNDELLETARTSLIRKEARDYETLGQQLSILNTINKYNLPKNYIEINQKQLRDLTSEKGRELIAKHLNVDDMVFIIVGDAKTQLEGIKALGIGEVVLVDSYGNPIEDERKIDLK